MPWRPADAHRHKRGLSARQARQWSRVANNMLQRCLTQGGSQSTCEARAIRGANAAVGEPELSTEQTQHQLTVNTVITVPPAHMVLNNQEYLTAPCVMIVEGVLNGGLIPAEEFRPHLWNGMPIVLNHPLDVTGHPHSARQPDVLAQCGLGHIYNAQVGRSQRQGQAVASLRGELWINVAQVPHCGPEAQQAVDMLESQTPLEISTAFYSQAERMPGSFYGQPYQEIHRQIQPDHLALLPNAIGACSLADGCGAPRLHHAACGCADPEDCQCEGEPMEDAPPRGWRGFVQLLRDFVSGEALPEEELPADPAPALVTERTDTDLREALYGALAREMGMDLTPIFIQTIDAGQQSFVYTQGERLVQRLWTVGEDNIVQLDPTIMDVQRETQFHQVPGTDGPVPAPEAGGHAPPSGFTASDDPLATDLPASSRARERDPMTTPAVSPVAIKARVNNLIANQQYGWTERDRPMLEAQTEAFLIRLESQPVLVAPPEPPPEPEPPQTAHEAIARMPTHLQDMFNAMYREHQERRQVAIAELIANTNNPFGQDELQTMTVDRLEKLASGFRGVEYTGRGLPAPRPAPVTKEAPPEPPRTMDLVVEQQKALGLRQ